MNLDVAVTDFLTSAQIADVLGGTGAIDVTAAIQTAENLLSAAFGQVSGGNSTRNGTLHFPPGRYRVATVTSGVCLTKSPNTCWMGDAILDFTNLTSGNFVGVQVVSTSNASDGAVNVGSIRGLQLKGPSVLTKGNITSGSNVVTSLGTTAGMASGQTFAGPGIPLATTISSVDSSSQIHISANATLSLTQGPLAAFAPSTVGILLGGGSGGTSYATGHELQELAISGWGVAVEQGNNGYSQRIRGGQVNDNAVGIYTPSGLSNAAEQWDIIGVLLSNLGANLHINNSSMDVTVTGGSSDYCNIGINISGGAAIVTALGAHVENQGYERAVWNSSGSGSTGQFVGIGCKYTLLTQSTGVPFIDASNLNVVLQGGWLRTNIGSGTQGTFVKAGLNADIDVAYLNQGGATLTNFIDASSATGTVRLRLPAGGYGSVTNLIYANGNTSATFIVDLGNGLSFPAGNQSPGQTDHGKIYIPSGSITFTIPHSTALWTGWTITVNAQNGAQTITPNASDKINGGTAGVSYTLASGITGKITTDGNGNLYVI